MTLTHQQLFMLPFLGHFVLIALLYTWLTLERQVAIFRREVKIGDFVRTGSDTPRAMRVARNLANQFELPIFALFAALFIYFSNAVTLVDIAAAWLFLAGRLIHTVIQTLTTNVALRGIVYAITFIAVTILMIRVAQLVLCLPASPISI